MAQATIGYAAMLEQFGPHEVIEYSALAEQRGFSGVMAADHFQPWVPQQGQAAFVWNVMTGIGERSNGGVGPGGTRPPVRDAAGHRRPGLGDAGGDVPRPSLARSRFR